MPHMWLRCRQRRKCCNEYQMGRTGPSGTRGDTCGVEPRLRWALAHAECQSQSAFWHYMGVQQRLKRYCAAKKHLNHRWKLKRELL